ncbi:TNT domain-containing protein [Streptacidiphilus sp. MAP12-33]|uniref:TNT domain-containing protein n=1 Tax=Streptacidiphilus sp. MAP12-33 TaxID=3156266 RepID=UPI003514C5CD
MTVVQNIAKLGAGLALLAATCAFTGAPATASVPTTPDHHPSDVCSAALENGDARLGPAQLPTAGPVGHELRGYQRTGGASTASFLAQFWDPTANGGKGGWLYPPQNGYLLKHDGSPIETHQHLGTGQSLDRFGSEYGSFLAPEGAAYSARSIPPQSLVSSPAAGCNYHAYKVLKPFTVDGGPVAPWFDQPGLGWQYQLDPTLVPGAPAQLNVLWLVQNGFLQRLV